MNILDLIRPDLLDLQPYSSARDEYTGKEGVFLDANENPFVFKTLKYIDTYRYAKVWWNNETYFIDNKEEYEIKLLFLLFRKHFV